MRNVVNVSRYHPLLVALHWLVAILIAFTLARGFLNVARLHNNDPAKIAALRQHMTIGIVILTSMTIRLIVRLRTTRPPPATTGFSALDRIAVFTHYGFYFLVFAMAATGLATAFLSRLFPIVFGGLKAPLPHSFLIFPTRVAHGYIAWAILAFAAVHILAVLFHQFVRNDGLIRRMWFAGVQNRSRYHPLLVSLHWLVFIGITVSLSRGFFSLIRIPNADPAKILALRQHMTVGIIILALMAIRLIVRLTTQKPQPATTGFSALDRIAVLTHYGLYLLIFAMAGTGLATVILAGDFPILYGGLSAPLPHSFLIYPTRVAHGYIAWTIVCLIALHVLAALYHQFIRKDGLLRRMWFGQDSRPGARDGLPEPVPGPQ